MNTLHKHSRVRENLVRAATSPFLLPLLPAGKDRASPAFDR